MYSNTIVNGLYSTCPVFVVCITIKRERERLGELTFIVLFIVK